MRVFNVQFTSGELSALIYRFCVNTAIVFFASICGQVNAAQILVDKMPEHAQNQQSADKPTTSEQQNSKKQPHWIEQIHHSVSDSVYQSAVWFDRFFVNENNDYESPKTNARIRLGWKPQARDWNGIEARFRIKVRLPHFEDKVDLILSDDEETAQNQLPFDSTNNQADLGDERFAAALRYTHNPNRKRLLESRIGISGGDLFFKVRHKRYLHWQQKHSVRIEPSIFYFIGDGLGAKLQLEYDYQFNAITQYRINYSIRGSEDFSGAKWKHGFYQLKQLGSKRASIWGLKVQGVRNSERGYDVDKYTLSYRYRFNALRKWLFFEVEPFLQWPEDQDYRTTPGMIFRIEGYFDKG